MWTEEVKSGRWRGGFRNPSTGRKVQRTFDYRYEAEAWAKRAEEAARRAAESGSTALAPAPAGDPLPGHQFAPQIAIPAPRPACPTVAEYAAIYLNARRGKIAAGTLDEYEGHLRRGILADPDLAATRLDDLTREAVDEWIGDLVDNEVGLPSINKRLKVLRIMLNYAIDNDRISRNVTRQIGYLPTDLREIRVVTREQEAALLAECRTPEARAQILLALDAGLRWGEVAGLAVSGISGDYLVVRQVVDRYARKIRHYPKDRGRSKGGRTARVVPMTPRLREALAVIALVAEVRGPDALLFGSIGSDGAARPLDPHNWRRDMWRGVTHRAGVNRRGDRLHFHDLRHTYGSRLAADPRVPRTEIATLMGHADEKTTAIYIHAGDDGHRLALVTGALVDVEAGSA